MRGATEGLRRDDGEERERLGLGWLHSGRRRGAPDCEDWLGGAAGSGAERSLSCLDYGALVEYLRVMAAGLKDFPPLILASASPRRAELLRQLSIAFDILPAEVAEIHHEQLTARELAQLNAYRKARNVAKRFADRVILGADTLVYLDTTLFGKPATLEEAFRMLEQLQGRTHEVITGICLLHLRSHRQAMFAESTVVTFRPLDEASIRRYLSHVNPLDKAGAYAIQEQGDLIVEKVAGSYTNVVGLPLERLRAELESWAEPGP
jgi:septum formation protein